MARMFPVPIAFHNTDVRSGLIRKTTGVASGT